MKTTYRLAKSVQIRKESWGLLFYVQTTHKLFFIKSGDWLKPEHFDGTWAHDRIVKDVADRSGKTEAAIQSALPELLDSLIKNGTIENELC